MAAFGTRSACLSDSVKNALLKELQDGGENCASWLKMAQPGRSIEAARARSVHACSRVAVFLVLFAVAMRGVEGSLVTSVGCHL